ncbi:DUF1800 domain-containing protein [Aquimarina agarivorans]|uniref:DUF1800 domain-containing protein n=1 Tax=Aquimarina agarivorans TaxID=980584 RepID=UPI000248FDB2|nr:DUF1800 family protein [Aquimarina agarivorans]
MRLFITFLITLFTGLTGFAQLYDDFYGAGHNKGIIISSSGNDEASPENDAENTVSGILDKLTLKESARFLAQASLGIVYEDVLAVQEKTPEEWIDDQIKIPYITMSERYVDIANDVDELQEDKRFFGNITDFTFYEMTFKQNDLLRQRMAFAWSQIFVVNVMQNSFNRTRSKAVYYDLLYEGAFGNFRDMLFNVTMSMAMGTYLSHFTNRKFNPRTGALPDENYAREIMQLFTIGVNELNIDGTPKLDGVGKPIPTYDIDDVAELAKVFTGLSCSKKLSGANNDNFNISFPFRNWAAPMKMFDEFHSEGEKKFIGKTIPAGQTGMQDINQALDFLFNHPNVGPFIAIRLIQHLVKSNPSKPYVARVARVFNNNGKGVRGDLEAVTKAVLLDPEARECAYINTPTNGKLVQPLERFISLFKAFKVSTPSGKFYLDDGREYSGAFLQGFNDSPSVFNFFQFDYAEEMSVGPKNLVSPEFQILNTVTSITYINTIEHALKVRPFNNYTGAAKFIKPNNRDKPILDFSEEIALYNSSGIDELLDRLDILLCRGQLTPELREIIKTTITENETNISRYSDVDAVHDCIYYIMISPDYMIQL